MRYKFQISVVYSIVIAVAAFAVLSANSGIFASSRAMFYRHAAAGAALLAAALITGNMWSRRHAWAATGILLAFNYAAFVRDPAGIVYYFWFFPVAGAILCVLLLMPCRNKLLYNFRKLAMLALAFVPLGIGSHTLLEMYAVKQIIPMPMLLGSVMFTIFAILGLVKIRQIRTFDRYILIVYSIAGSLIIRQMFFVESILQYTVPGR